VGQEKPTSSSSASSTVVGRLTNEAVAVLGEGIRLCFLRWTALQLAVENEWGGHTSKLKAQQLQSDVLSWFTRSKGKIHTSNQTLMYSFHLLLLLLLHYFSFAFSLAIHLSESFLSSISVKKNLHSFCKKKSFKT
jgi:hypothetical protein